MFQQKSYRILVNKVIPAKHSLYTMYFIGKNEIKIEFYKNKREIQRWSPWHKFAVFQEKKSTIFLFDRSTLRKGFHSLTAINLYLETAPEPVI